MKTIISIDPGPEQSAFLMWDGQNIGARGIESNQELLSRLGWPNDIEAVLVIEQVASFGMPVGAEVFETVFWSGRFAQVWDAHGRHWYRLKRHQIKTHLCQNSRAKDSNIRQALIDKLGPPGVKKAPGVTYGISKDLWSALAIAVTFAETSG